MTISSSSVSTPNPPYHLLFYPISKFSDIPYLDLSGQFATKAITACEPGFFKEIFKPIAERLGQGSKDIDIWISNENPCKGETVVHIACDPDLARAVGQLVQTNDPLLMATISRVSYLGHYALSYRKINLKSSGPQKIVEDRKILQSPAIGAETIENLQNFAKKIDMESDLAFIYQPNDRGALLRGFIYLYCTAGFAEALNKELGIPLSNAERHPDLPHVSSSLGNIGQPIDLYGPAADRPNLEHNLVR